MADKVTMDITMRVTFRARFYLWLARRLGILLARSITAAGIPCLVSVDVDDDRINLDRLVKIPGVTK